MVDELRHFLLVVEHGTFTEAARRAHLTQPSLSASIARLEAALGARLLHRDRHGSSLTAAGEALVPRAREVLGALENARRAVSEVAGLRAGEVRVGAGATVCTYYLPAILKRYRERFPAVGIKLRELTSAEVFDALHEGAIDLGVVTGGTVGERWRDDALVLVVKPGVDPVGAPLVTFPRGASTREHVDRLFPRAEIAMELSSIATVKGHVRAGLGVALLSRTAVENDLAAGRLALVDDRRLPVTRTLRLVHRGADRLSPAAAALRAMIREDAAALRRRTSA
jgi:DNA-binding transcriptional LysR family regulator